MNLDFEGAGIKVTMSDILKKISEFDIFKRYCSNFEEVDVSFCSEFRTDNSPSCRVYINPSNRLMYKDFGNGDIFSCWDYVMAKYGCQYPEAINIVANDFNIGSNKVNLNPKILIGNEEFMEKAKATPRPKSTISILEQPYTLIDHNYWSQYGIDLELLAEFDVYSAKVIYLIKGNKRTTFEYTKNNPCYAYRFTRDGHYSYKIYWPLADKRYKWLFSGGGGAADDIEGYDQLPLNGDLLILTKSLKDVMVLRVLGYPAISLQGEANKLNHETYERLSKRFDIIISLYDNDAQGETGAKYLLNTYGIEPIFIPKESGFKDISDYVKEYGVEEGKKLMKEL